MTWHIVTVPAGDLGPTVVAIRRNGGVVTNSKRCPTGYVVTYVTGESGK